MLPNDRFAYSSPFRDIHPLEKGIFSCLFLGFSLVTENEVSLLFIFLLMSAVIILRVKVSIVFYLKLLLLPFLFLLMSILTILISFAPVNMEIGSTILNVEIGKWQMYMSLGNLKRGMDVFFSVLAGISCMYFLILSTPIGQLIWLLKKIHLPDLFIELFILIYRFIFILMKNMNEIRTAQTSRLGYNGLKQSFLSLGQLVMGVFLKSMRTAKEAQIAVESRGNGGAIVIADLNLPFRRKNWVKICCTFFALCFITFVF